MFKNFVLFSGKKGKNLVLTFLSLLFLISFISAGTYSDCNIYGNCKPSTTTTASVNYSTVNTNNSIFWNGYSWHNMSLPFFNAIGNYVPYAGATRDLDMGLNSINFSSGSGIVKNEIFINQTYVKFTKGTSNTRMYQDASTFFIGEFGATDTLNINFTNTIFTNNITAPNICYTNGTGCPVMNTTFNTTYNNHINNLTLHNVTFNQSLVNQFYARLDGSNQPFTSTWLGIGNLSNWSRVNTNNEMKLTNKVIQVGDAGYAVNLNLASSQFIRFGDVYDAGQKNMSISLWFYIAGTTFTGGGTHQMIVTKGGYFTPIQAPLYIRGVTGANTVEFYNQIDTPSRNWAGSAVQGWNHVVNIRDYTANKTQTYLNGVMINESYYTAMGDASNADNLMLGAWSNGALPIAGYYFSGAVDEFQIWNKSLTSTEVASLWNSGNGAYGTTDANTLNIWHMDENSGNNITGINTSVNGSILNGGTWITGKMNGIASIQDAQIISSKDGVAPNERTIITLGDSAGRLVLQGSNITFLSNPFGILYNYNNTKPAMDYSDIHKNNLTAHNSTFWYNSTFNASYKNLREYNASYTTGTGIFYYNNSDPKLYLHYNFDDNINDSLSKYNGTCTSCPTFVNAKLNNGTKYDGANNFVNITGVSTSGNITLTMWINVSIADTTSDYILDSASGRFVLASFSPTSGQWGYYDNTAWRYCGDTPNDGSWHHIALALNTSNGACYIDGVLQSIQVASIVTIAGETNIGKNSGADLYHYNGVLDDFRIYNRTLSATEILDLKNLGTYSNYTSGGTLYSTNNTFNMSNTDLYIKNLYADGILPNFLANALGSFLLRWNAWFNNVNINGTLNNTGRTDLDGTNVWGYLNVTGNIHLEGNLSVKRPYGMFSSIETQNVAVASTAYTFNFTNIEDAYQVYLAGDKKNISFGQTGDYLIELSIIAQGSQGDRVEVWVQKNGVNIPRSNTIYDFKGTGSNAVLAVPFILDMNMTDSFRIMYAGSATAVKFPYTTNTSYSPETPSIIMTISKISEITE